MECVSEVSARTYGECAEDDGLCTKYANIHLIAVHG